MLKTIKAQELSLDLVIFLKDYGQLPLKDGFMLYIPSVNENTAKELLNKEDLAILREIIDECEVNKTFNLIIKE